MPELIIHQNDTTKTIQSEKTDSLLDHIIKNDFDIALPCSGKGKCGKCRVRIHGVVLPYTTEEKALLSDADMQNGIHLACMTKADTDMEIMLPFYKERATIQTHVNTTVVLGAPIIRKRFLQIQPPDLSDQQPDEQRLLHAINQESNSDTDASPKPFSCSPLPLTVLKKLPEVLRKNSFSVTVTEVIKMPVDIESGDTTAKTLYGIAIDIGTTTLAAYLYDLNEGVQLAVASSLNPQKNYGADVISRIDYASKSEENKERMSDILQKALLELAVRATHLSKLKLSDISLACLAGNTTMIHLLLGIPASYMAIAPFIPTTLTPHMLVPNEVNLPIHPNGRIIILPSVSAYVGADTVAAVLSSRMYENRDITLLVDIGTNGEIVLGNDATLFACSTAAGPAFEGANIACGMGGIEGAISEVSLSPDGSITYHTIGKEKPLGICGSGLIDAIACMLRAGILDETGRIEDPDELPADAAAYSERITEYKGQKAFILVPAADTKTGDPIVITQKDIREVQNAKAAIAAGISVLLDKAGFTLNDIQAVYMAGGFGSYLRISSAIAIGLFPGEWAGKIRSLGNAAGAGAIHCLLSKEELSKAVTLAGRISYVELSSTPLFVEEYTNHMFF